MSHTGDVTHEILNKANLPLLHRRRARAQFLKSVLMIVQMVQTKQGEARLCCSYLIKIDDLVMISIINSKFYLYYCYLLLRMLCAALCLLTIVGRGYGAATVLRL